MKKIMINLITNMPGDCSVVIRRYVTKKELEKYLGQLEEHKKRVKELIENEF